MPKVSHNLLNLVICGYAIETNDVFCIFKDVIDYTRLLSLKF